MSFDETYFDSIARVRLLCSGPECRVEIQQKTIAGQHPEVDIEFLLQPRDQTQCPVGRPLVLHVQHCQLHDDPRTGAAHAWYWLPPALTPALLKRCHLRLKRDRLPRPSQHCEA